MKPYRILYRVKLGPKHKATGFTEHIIHGEPMEMPTELWIAQFPGEQVVYLYYCDDTGLELSDTLHDSVPLAMEQAELEFCVTPSEWEPA